MWMTDQSTFAAADKGGIWILICRVPVRQVALNLGSYRYMFQTINVTPNVQLYVFSIPI